jgi:hypothetical protein
MEECASIFSLDVKKKIEGIHEKYHEMSMDSEDDYDYDRHSIEYKNDSKSKEDGYVDDLFESLLYK